MQLRRRLSATTAVAAVGLVMMAAVPAIADEQSGLDAELTAVVSVSGMVFTPAGAEVVADDAPVPTLTRVVHARTADTLDRAVDDVVNDLWSAMERSNGSSQDSDPDVHPMDSQTLIGDCGISWVVLKHISGYEAYTEAGFNLDSEYSGEEYSTDLLVASSATFDFWTRHFRDDGNLHGGTDWKKGTRFDVPEHQDYDAHLVDAVVSVISPNGAGYCNTAGPRVDDVPL